MLSKQYLFDTNCFVIPGRYYLQDIFPSFWQKLQQLIENHTVVVHETVLQEILPYKDELANWLENVPNYEPVKMNKKVLAKFIELSKWARSSEQNYTAQAISYFESNDKADAWICAQCAVSGYVLVTNEKSSNSPANVKIPNVCEAFGITYISMFDFMREQNFKF